MKKIFLGLFTIVTIFLLAACSELNSLKIEILGSRDYSIVQGEDLPDFLSGVTALGNDDKDYTKYLEVRHEIDNNVVNNYDLFFEVNYSNKIVSSKKQQVVIIETLIQETSFHIYGPTNIDLSLGKTKDDILSKYEVKDNKGTLVEMSILLDDSKIKYQTDGIYSATLSVKDQDVTISKAISVNIVDNTIIKNELSLFYLNDTHGAIFYQNDSGKEQLGLSRIDNHIRNYKTENSHKLSLFIAGGDMLQGQMASNYFEGASAIEALNAMSLDAFVIGNHEFDWGLEKVLQYFNGEHEIKATYPLLGANVYEKETNQRPEGIDPYTIIDRYGIKIGIIGVIGDGLESSIAKNRVSMYEFRDAYTEVVKYTNELREKENVDFIIVVNHQNDETFNRKVSMLDVNIVFNGHTHQQYLKSINGIPVIQSGSNGEYLGYAAFIKQLNDSWINSVNDNLDSYDSAYLNTSSVIIDEILSLYEEEINLVGDKIIIRNNKYQSRDTLTDYMAKLMALRTGADIAFHNYGGTRSDLSANENFTLKKLYAIFPFDNVIITLTLKGSYINQYMRGYGSNYYIDYIKNDNISDNKYYKVAVNDYSFGADNIFEYAQDIEQTGIVLRDLIYDALIKQAQKNTYFSTAEAYTMSQEKRVIA